MKKKKLLVILFCILVPYLGLTQGLFDSKYHKLLGLKVDSSVKLSELYDDFNKGVLGIFIIEVEGKTKSQLIREFKNWYSKYFVSLKTTLHGETEDQMVFNYVHRTSFKGGILQINTPWEDNIRLIVEFKDYKIRVQFIGGSSFVEFGEKSVVTNSSNRYFQKGIKYQLFLDELKHMSELLTDLDTNLKKITQDNW
jgi:hypothetical protein